MPDDPRAPAPDHDAFCRAIEAHLCRKNDGHLIRLVGPAFDLVMGWARQGIPLKVAEAGIDRYFERYYRKGPRRRPVRVEFCEADVLDAFDTWRRALGMASVVLDPDAGAAVEEPLPAGGRARRSLANQIERLQARLTVLRGSDQAPPALGAALDNAVRQLDALRGEASRARGDARDRVAASLSAIDEALVAAAAASLPEGDRQRLEREAVVELAPFRARMTPEAYAESRRAAFDRLVRAHFTLPEM